MKTKKVIRGLHYLVSCTTMGMALYHILQGAG